MFKKRTINEYFTIIEKNHQDYLETQMVPHLGIPGTENKKTLIDRYLTYINNFRELKKADLNEDIRGSTVTENVERGTFSAFLGMLIGGLFFATEQHAPSADLFGVKTAVQGGFATAIGASCSALIYTTWDKSNEKPAHADFNTCEAEMKKAGFTDERYSALSAELVKLFHFRECLLLGLGDKNKISMRDAFKSQYYSSNNTHDFVEKDFNLAIEVYFLEQLNELFQQAFKKIHEIHDKEIHDEKQESEFSLWFKRHFESNENRQKFTQQMQVQFIKNCIDFLENEINQPGFLGSYLYLIDFMAGLITASFAVGIFAVTTLFIPVFALVSIALAAAALGAIGTHLAITQTDALYYKRDKNNRHAIQGAIDSITMEQKRLTTLLQTVVITTSKDLTELKKYDDNDHSSFLKILRGDSQKHIALGGVRAWIREFASRFNESKVVEIDLSERIQALVDGAHNQTQSLQTKLLSYMTSTTTQQPTVDSLTPFIKETIDYLINPDNAEFIRTFESVQKIKEQVLEIIGFIPSTLSTRALPEIFVKFYTDPISIGGLGGLRSDLDQVRRLAPVVVVNSAANQNHPYQRFLDTAFTIQLKLNDTPKAPWILQGDIRYRNMLGLPSNHTVRIEEKINSANIHDYLNESFNFLCSLNQYEDNIDWHGAFQNNDSFILYRMLLIKQLANLADQNNMRVDSLVKDVIKQFVKSTLNYNPDVAFDDILNQALLIESGQAGAGAETIRDKLGNPRLLSELSYIADAVRVDMAYVLSAFSPEQLIALEASHFLIADNDKIIFGYNSIGQLTPEPSKDFYDKINDTINVTTAFLAAINTSTLLQQTSTIKLYLQVIANEINHIHQQIDVLKPLLVNSNIQPLDDVLNALETFKQSFGLPKPLPKPLPEPLAEPLPTMNPQPSAPLILPNNANTAPEQVIKKRSTPWNFFPLGHKNTQTIEARRPAPATYSRDPKTG